jgi:hypothetical protein
MSSYFLDNASEYGVENDSSIDEEIYAPVRLSNSTRRFNSASDYRRDLIDSYSPDAQMEQEAIARRLEIDKMQDEAVNREIANRVNAAAWNDKVRAQQQAGEVSQALIDLDPTQPDYLMQVDTILKDKPLARMNENISQLLGGRAAINAEAQQERERMRALEDSKAVAQENIVLNQQMSRETAEINDAAQRKAELRKETDKMGPAARAEFNKRVQETGDYEAAATAARDIQAKELTPTVYRDTLRRVNDLNQNIAAARKTIADLQGDILKKDTPETTDMIKELQSGIVGYKAEIEDAQARVINPYISKFGTPDKKDDAAPKPTTSDAPKSAGIPDGIRSSAKAWLKNNPNHPEAERIRAMLANDAPL